MDGSVTQDPRYPIGPFASLGRPLDTTERDARIEAIAEHPARIRAAVEGLSDTQLDTPYREGGWTVRQVVHHLADSHVNAYVRFKLGVTEDAPTLKSYDEGAWANLPDAERGPAASSLSVLDAIHARWVAFLGALAEDDFGRTVVYTNGRELTIDVLLEIYAWHGAHHVAHVTRLRERMGW